MRPNTFAMKKLFLLFILILFFHSCSEPVTDEPTPSDDPYRISLEQAIAEVENCLEAIDSGTRSSGRRRIGECYLAGARTGFTRATDAPDASDTPSVYIVNFTDDEGYAIVATDLRAPGTVLALTDSGHLGPDDRIEVPGAILFLEHTEQLLTSTIPPVTSENTEIRYGDWCYAMVGGPECEVEWHQQKPFNMFAPEINGRKAPAGCLATALAQFMTIYNYPPKYNWEEMCKHSRRNEHKVYEPAYEMIGTLFKDISTPDNLDIQYSPSGSGGIITNVRRTLRNMGYSDTGVLENYDTEVVNKALTDRFPIIIAGFTNGTNEQTTSILSIPIQPYASFSGHAWLIDSGINMTRQVTLYDKIRNKVIFTRTETKRLVHCNFGWLWGSSNGYYYSGSFDTQKGPVKVDRLTQPLTDYSYGMKICYGAKNQKS